jgi:branched-chain amino acid transport system substrate-binding protein
MNLAVIDINSYLESQNSKYRFSSLVYDTKLDTSLAKSAIEKAFTDNKIKYFIGPQSSAELAAVRAYANANNLLVVSQGSTASSLAIANDALFRFCPGDAVEGAAMANSIFSAGKRKLITVARDDAGNKGLQQSVGTNFSSIGGQTTAVTPYAIGMTDFSTVLADIKQKLMTNLATTDSNSVGIYLASFDECKDLFEQASVDPIFSKVKWYGGDGIVLDPALINSNKAAAFAAKVNFFAPNYGIPATPNPKLDAIVAAIKSKTSIDIDAYGLAAYDAMWVIAKTIVENQNALSDFSLFKTSFNKTSNAYTGLTGSLALNANGDRASGTFDYYGIVFENNVYKWKLVGKSI